MKGLKGICVTLLIVLLATCSTALFACTQSKYDTAVQNGDNYTIVASYDSTSHTISATQITTYTNTTDNAFDCIKMHVYANAYRQGGNVVPNTYKSVAYPNGESFGEIEFDNVSVDGNACAFRIEGDNLDILSLPLDKQLFPNEQVTLEMTYTVTLANIKHRLGYTDNVVNCANWFPIVCATTSNDFDTTPYYAVGDPFVSQCANYDVTFRVPTDYTVAASGQLVAVTSNADGDTWRFEGNAMRDFALTLSDKYKKLSKTYDDTQINYYYYDDQNAESSLETAVDSFAYFSKNIGKYPYTQYTVCQTDFCYGGMEYPSLVYVSCGSPSYKDAIVHETAHQWFYAVVGNDQINNAWMDEGLAEYLTCLYLDSVGETPLSTSVKNLTKSYVTYVDVLNRYYDQVDASFRPLDKYKNDGEYVVITYTKGALLFDTLQQTMGETKFFKALKDYYDNNSFAIATPQNLTDSFVKISGNEMAAIFQKFANGSEILSKITD